MTAISEKLYFASPVRLQNMLVSAMGYKLYQKRYTGIYHNLRELVRESREWSEAKQTDYQSEQLHTMVKHCRENIPYYQSLFAEYGLHENDITSPTDLIKLPVLSKKTLRERGREFRTGRETPFIIQRTSGSTGTPLSLHVNERTYKLAMALLVDHEEFHGVPFGARRATFAGRMIQRPENMNPPFARFNRAENQRLYSSYHLNQTTFPHYQRDLDRFQPLEIIGYPSAISDLANHYQQSNSKPNFRPKAIITNSETLLEWQRERIESVFQAPIFDYYGTAEYVLFAGQGLNGLYKINPIISITEILPTDESTTTGSVVATSLTNTCMPLLRYNLGDVATRTPSTRDAQTSVSYLKSITGRVDDYVLTPDGRRIGRLDHIFKGTSNISEAQIVQDSIDHCKVIVVKQNKNASLNSSEIIKNLKLRAGEKMKIDIEVSHSIPRNRNGKFRSVISLMNENEECL